MNIRQDMKGKKHAILVISYKIKFCNRQTDEIIELRGQGGVYVIFDTVYTIFL